MSAELKALLEEFGNAHFDCGAWDGDAEDEQAYEALRVTAHEAEAKLLAHINASRSEKPAIEAPFKELYGHLLHSLDNTDEALEHLTTLATEVVKWCEAEASGDMASKDVWERRAALLRKQLEADKAIDQEATNADER